MVAAQDWSWIDSQPPTESVIRITRLLCVGMDRFIPKVVSQVNSSHPWLDARCVELVRLECAAAGTDAFLEASLACSRGLLAAQSTYIARVRGRLRTLRRGSKKWWRLSDQLLNRVSKPANSALKKSDGTWALTRDAKADLFVDTFQSR